MKIPFKSARWVGIAGLYSPSTGHARADRRSVARHLRKFVSRLIFLDEKRATLLEMMAKPLGRLTGIDLSSLVQVLYRKPVFMGYPTTRSIESTYWRKKEPLPANPDPDRDHCGVLWLCPAVPFTWEDIRQALAIVYQVANKYSLEPNVAITFPSERCVYLLPSLLFDRDDSEEDTRALACHDEMLRRMTDAGYLPYRLGIQSMSALPSSVDDYRQVLKRIKATLDPTGIVAPGRYDLGAAKEAPGL
jgi:4-cresol dehydrogenase (hydroxylating)